MTAPTVTPLPDAPLAGDTEGVFSAKASVFVPALAPFGEEVNAVGQYCEGVAASASAAANFRGRWSDLTGALAIPSAVLHAGEIWLLLADLADVTASEPGATADWVALTPRQLRNAIINGDFRIWQRGTSISSSGTTVIYGADRFATRTADVSRQTFTAGQTDVPGEPEFYHRRTLASATVDGSNIGQRIEGVQSFAGQTVTVSFWARASAAVVCTAHQFIQAFGSGGSTAVGTSIGDVELTTSWQRFQFTVTVPSVTGKTIGTNNYLEWLMRHTGANGTTIDVARVQVEAGHQATPFEVRPLALEMLLCQRYYWRTTHGRAWLWSGRIESGWSAGAYVKYPVPMRTTPSVTNTLASSTGFDTGSLAVGTGGADGHSVNYTGNSTSSIGFHRGDVIANAEL